MSGIVIRYKATKTDKLVVALVASVAVSYAAVLARLPLALAFTIGAVGVIASLYVFLKPSNRCTICDHAFNTSSPAGQGLKTSQRVCKDCHKIALISGQNPQK